MKLNKDQQLASDVIVDMYSTDRQVTIVRGPGGTGKSHSVVDVLNNNKKMVGSVCLTAPTNKAVGVLSDFRRQVGVTANTKTIYNLLGLVVGNDGEIKNTFAAHDGSFDMFNTVVLDEGSMADRQLCNILQDKLYEFPRTKLIVMADHCQLPPVNESVSHIFDMGEVVDLSIDMRSGNGPLLNMKREVRDLVLARLNGDYNRAVKASLDTAHEGPDDSGVHFLMGNDFQGAMLDMFDTHMYKDDPNFVRALAWTNAEVERLNRIIRRRLYGNNAPLYVPGERVCVLNPVYDQGGDCVFATDDECTVLDMVEDVYEDYTDHDNKNQTYSIYRMTVRDMFGIDRVIRVLHERSIRKFNRRCEFLAGEAKAKRRPWKNFWAFKDDMFVNLRPAHAMTVHKSQGQTLGCTFVNMKDIMKNKRIVERAQLAYVATSRPTTDLVSNLRNVY